jgi:hypothetical protein
MTEMIDYYNSMSLEKTEGNLVTANKLKLCFRASKDRKVANFKYCSSQEVFFNNFTFVALVA